MFLVSSCSCRFPSHWSQVLSRKWKCSWSTTSGWSTILLPTKVRLLLEVLGIYWYVSCILDVECSSKHVYVNTLFFINYLLTFDYKNCPWILLFHGKYHVRLMDIQIIKTELWKKCWINSFGAIIDLEHISSLTIKVWGTKGVNCCKSCFYAGILLIPVFKVPQPMC